MKSDNRRKLILINRKFQVFEILKFVILDIEVMVIYGVIIFVFMNHTIELNQGDPAKALVSIKEMLLPMVFILTGINIFVSSIVTTIYVLYSSHRIAGPLYRFNTALTEAAQGNLTPVTNLREGDQLEAVSHSLQAMLDVFRNDLETIGGRVCELQTQIQDSNSSNEQNAACDEIAAILAKYRPRGGATVSLDNR